MAKRRNSRSDASDVATPATTAQPEPRRAREGNEQRVSDNSASSAPSSAQNPVGAESMTSQPSEEEIRHRAYQRYLQRGGGHGMDFEDWLEAERELKNKKVKSEK